MIYTIYGRPKTGKTTFALSGRENHKKTLIINADQGLVGVNTEGATIVNDVSINNLNQIIDDPNLSKKYDRVVIDTVTQLYDEFLIEASGGKTPSLNTRGAVNNVFANLLRSLRSSGIKEIICLAQEKIILPSEDWSPDDDEEDAVASVTIHLPAGASNTLCVMSDVIGRLYIAHVNEKNVRRLWVSPTPGIVAGARSQHYREKPPYLVKPTISRLNKLLGWTD